MTPEPTAEARMSELGRLSGVIVDPKKAFADIAERPRWWPPLVLLVLMGLAMMYTFSQRVGWDRAIRTAFENNTRVQSLTPEQREQAMSRALGFASISAYGGAILGPPIVSLALAGVLLLVFKMMGAQFSFKQSFAVYCYASLTGLVYSALAILVMFLKNPDDFDIQHPLIFNLGAFLPDGTAKWLKAFGYSIDLFSIWLVLLLAVGLAAADRRLGFSKALTGVVGCWVVLVVLKVGWAAMFG